MAHNRKAKSFHLSFFFWSKKRVMVGMVFFVVMLVVLLSFSSTAQVESRVVNVNSVLLSFPLVNKTKQNKNKTKQNKTLSRLISPLEKSKQQSLAFSSPDSNRFPLTLLTLFPPLTVKLTALFETDLSTLSKFVVSNPFFFLFFLFFSFLVLVYPKHRSFSLEFSSLAKPPFKI